LLALLIKKYPLIRASLSSSNVNKTYPLSKFNVATNLAVIDGSIDFLDTILYLGDCATIPFIDVVTNCKRYTLSKVKDCKN